MSRTTVKPPRRPLTSPLRHWLVLGGIAVLFVLLAGRALFLQVFNADFLQQRGNAQALRALDVPAVRGMILDRNGQPLAVSTPVDSVCADPAKLHAEPARWKPLARALGVSYKDLKQTLTANRDRHFVYLRRHVLPDKAERIMALDIDGVFLQREYKRYYPLGAVTGHLVGFTDVDDGGLEGVEVSFNPVLQGVDGKDLVIRDASGHVIEHVSNLERARDGDDLVLSIDARIQYLAYRELKKAVTEHRAGSGMAVVVDVRSGEILALVNQPVFNPNDRNQIRAERFRNRVVTDSFEPGSTVKPLTVAAALEAGRVTPETIVETAGGSIRLAGYTVNDTHDYGDLSVANVIMKSSNVGAARIAMQLEAEELWRMFSAAGFGAVPGSGLVGEAGGSLAAPATWRPVKQATLGYGYGLAVTTLQLAQAYAMLANDGVRVPLTITRRERLPAGDRVISAATAREVRRMLELAVSDEGTGRSARIPMYRVAGKTGTARKIEGKGYSTDRYTALFAGMAPASAPRLAMVVVVNEPSAGKYYGGSVAAPVFAGVMASAMRLLNVPPDDVPAGGVWLANAEAQR